VALVPAGDFEAHWADAWAGVARALRRKYTSPVIVDDRGALLRVDVPARYAVPAVFAAPDWLDVCTFEMQAQHLLSVDTCGMEEVDFGNLRGHYECEQCLAGLQEYAVCRTCQAVQCIACTRTAQVHVDGCKVHAWAVRKSAGIAKCSACQAGTWDHRFFCEEAHVCRKCEDSSEGRELIERHGIKVQAPYLAARDLNGEFGSLLDWVPVLKSPDTANWEYADFDEGRCTVLVNANPDAPLFAQLSIMRFRKSHDNWRKFITCWLVGSHIGWVHDGL
jgi:hypothetical protein